MLSVLKDSQCFMMLRERKGHGEVYSLRRMRIREAETTESNTHIQCNLAGVSRLRVLHGVWFEAVVNGYSSDSWRGTACADSSFRGGIPRAFLIGSSRQGDEVVTGQQSATCSQRGGRLASELETSHQELGCRPLWPFPVIFFVPGRPAELTLGNSLHSPEPHFPKFVKWTR